VKKFFSLIFLSVCLLTFTSNSVYAMPTYEVVMPDQSILKNEGVEAYSEKIRELNWEQIKNLPETEQQIPTREVLKVIAELNKDKIEAITRMKEESVKEGRASWTNYGDILITLDSWKQIVGNITWNHGHAGICANEAGYTIEAPGAGLNVRKTANYNSLWGKSLSTDELYVGGASQNHYVGAIRNAELQVGKPYGFSTMSDRSKWYCSKLVYYGWETQGFYIKNPTAGSSFDIILGFVAVTPSQMLWDNDVFWYQDVPSQGYGKQ